MDYWKDFGDFEGEIWFSCIQQGVLPKAALAEAQEEVSWKVAPFKLTQERTCLCK